MSRFTINDVADLAEHHSRNPRVHPNGFIQLDINYPASPHSTRIHIWHPLKGNQSAAEELELPRQTRPTPIHDHAFDMRSFIVHGRLTQVVFDGSVNHRMSPTHTVYVADYHRKSESTLVSTGVDVLVEQRASIQIPSGQDYTQAAGTFHESRALNGLVITVMQKVKTYPDYVPKVLVPHDTEPDNDFDRATALDEQTLWDSIWRSIAEAS